MSIRDRAVEAAIREFVKPRMHSNESYGKLRADLGAVLDAALAVLHPTVPNTVEALDRLPVGTVLRGVDQDGGLWLVWRAEHVWRDDNQSHSAADLARTADDWGVDEWLVIYQPEEG